MVASGNWNRVADTATTTIATNDPGSDGTHLASATMITATAMTMPSGRKASGHAAAITTCHAATTALVACDSLCTPSADGTCCRKIMMPIPAVNPSITGQGM